MPESSEPEKFSIDEIIDRLKNPPSEQPLKEGQLVTRADGTQAIRVRKRKRRSHQPRKEEMRQRQRARMIQVSAVLILLLMALFGAGSAIIYANSAAFREQVLRMIGSSSGAQVKLEQFRVNPTRAVAGQMILNWPEGNPLRELSVRGVNAAINPSSFLGKTLTGEELNSDQGILSLEVPESSAPLHATTAVGGPRPVRFNRYAVQKLQVRVGPAAQPLGWLRDSEASFQPDNANGRPQLLLNRGGIEFRGWPKSRLDRAHIEFRDGEVDIVGMRVLHETDERGMMEIDGTVAPYVQNRPSVLAVRLDSFLLSGIAGPEMERLVSGRINTMTDPKSNQLSFTPGSGSAATLAVSFQNASPWPIELHGFPFLTGLARLLEDDWFERPGFDDEATGNLLRTADSVTIDGLDLRSKSRMAVRGKLVMTQNRVLSGELKIGIAEAMVKTASDRRLAVMAGPVEEGFRWFTLRVGGTSTVPTDNFIQLLEVSKPASAARPGETAPGVPSFEDLTKPE